MLCKVLFLSLQLLTLVLLGGWSNANFDFCVAEAKRMLLSVFDASTKPRRERRRAVRARSNPNQVSIKVVI